MKVNKPVTDLLKRLTDMQPLPKPKFSKGDCIMLHHTDKRIISLVTRVEPFETPIKDSISGMTHIGNYILQDIVNEFSQTNKAVKYKYTRTKRIEAIDAYYQKIDSKAARILYGISTEE